MIDICDDYGAVGDGTTDNTEAIQAALNTPSQVIRWPKGDFLITDRLVSAVARRLFDCHPGAKLIQATTGKGALLIKASENTINWLQIAGAGAVAPDPEDEEDEYQDGPGVGLQLNVRPDYINDFEGYRLKVSGFSVGILNIDADASRLVKCSLGPNGKNLVVHGNQDAMIVDNCTSGAHSIVNCEVRGNGAAEVRCGVWNANPAVEGGHAFAVLAGGELTLNGTHVEGLSDSTPGTFVNLAVFGDTNSILHAYSARFRDPDPARVHVSGGAGFRARLYATDANAVGSGSADIRAALCRVPLTWNGMKTMADDCLVVSNDPANIPTPSVEHAGMRIKILSPSGENVVERIIYCAKVGFTGGTDIYQWLDFI